MVSNHGDTNILVGISPLSKIVLMVAMKIAHFYIVQCMFEDKSILHYMDNEQFETHPGVQGRLN